MRTLLHPGTPYPTQRKGLQSATQCILLEEFLTVALGRTTTPHCGPDKASHLLDSALSLQGQALCLIAQEEAMLPLGDSGQAAECLMTPFPGSHPLKVQTSNVLQLCPHPSQGKVPRCPEPRSQARTSDLLVHLPLPQFFLTQLC